ncbi:MAG: type II/IV secretion system protein [Candidatus Eremiobacteraeota bacterium]|nr:type II/IV secretion system protein [Candidatus Eremiobacteraeota bacterium]
MIEVTAWRESKIARVSYNSEDGKVIITWGLDGGEERKEFLLSDIKKICLEGYTSNYEVELRGEGDKLLFKEKLLDKQDAENLRLFLEQEVAEASDIFDALKREPTSLEEARKIINEKLSVSHDRFEPDKFLRFLLFQAKHTRATGVHFNPGQQDIRVRFRIDGFLFDVVRLNREIYNLLLSVAKRLAKMMDLKRIIPREGVFYLGFPEPLGVRISLMPVTEGEKMTLRILPFESELPSLEELGMSPDIYDRYHALLDRKKGMVLVCGPAGSGKTTTIYASLLHRVEESGDTLNISTIEDPVESRVESFCQTQVNTSAGLTTLRGLSSILRQDPDVIMVGEIRDHKVGELVLRAAVDEHLVFSTVQANNAIQAFVRLAEMGIPFPILKNSILAALAQRLVRKICPYCAEEAVLPEPLKDRASALGIDEINYKEGRGCPACNMTGYLGRTGIFEMFVPNREFFDLLQSQSPSEDLISLAEKSGYRPLSEDATKKAVAGITTWEEINKF